MIVQRSESFDADVEHQFRWYLFASELDLVDARALAERFGDAVDTGLESLRRNPEMGRRRFGSYVEFVGIRSWRLRKPFHRFVIFYRIENRVLSAIRLLEGHSRLAAG